jgi:hypothetical protein
MFVVVLRTIYFFETLRIFFKYQWFFLLYSVYPVLLRQKGGVFFVLNQKCISKPVKCFLFQNGQKGSLLVFHVGNILIDKNSLCNDCILNKFIGFIQSLQVLWIVFISSHVTDHKFLEDVHKDSMQFSSQINRFLCNRPNGPLKAFGRPTMSRSFSVEDVRTSKQHRLDARSSYSKFYAKLNFSRHCLKSFYKTSRRRGNTSKRCPAFQNILSFLYGCEKE